MLRGNGIRGTVRLTASAPGLKAAVAQIDTK